ncbi:MAG: type III secretion system export apparatus subunit SctU [Chlamydiales bacterium]|nr:type III secretion system export apparatus subunit SctU [Chlamydiia bacterium]MCP5507237.1 type III secretion system export apparatus subunit SctU [Chlamydiales bacterium]
MGEKTEKATPKKLRDARKKGQVAKSQDLPSAFTFIISIWTTLGLIDYIYAKVSTFLIAVFETITKDQLSLFIPELYYQAMLIIFMCAMPVMLLVSLAGMTVTFLSVGPTFAPEVFKPDIKKFDPVQNLKSKFKLKTLFELAKQIFKISVASYLIYGVVYNAIPTLVRTVDMDIEEALMVYYSFLMEVVLKVGIFFIGVAVIDFVFQRRNFANEMKMEKFEVKQEYKNMEGDPQIKSKRRQIAQEIAYQEGPAAGVRGAQALITNPTHIAVAICYEREVDPAPYVVSMGEGPLAEMMIRWAEKYEIPIVRNITLAHKLWEYGDLYEFVPEDTYEAVAEILRWIASLKDGEGAKLEYSEYNGISEF